MSGRAGRPGRRTLEERIARKIIVAKASHLVRDECHLWQGARIGTARGGYAIIKIGGDLAVPTAVHRLVYERDVGPIPDGHEIDHICGVRNCVRASHLEPVERTEHIVRTWARRRLEVA